MPQQEIAVGVLVKHEPEGVGEIVECHPDGGVTVDFDDHKGRQIGPSVAARLKALPEDGLEARKHRTPAETGSWVQEAPLKLVAAALVDIGDNAKTPALKRVLEDLVLENVDKKWKGWWEGVQPTFQDSQHFDVKKNTKGAFEAVSLGRGVRVGDVPAEAWKAKLKKQKSSKKRPLTTKDWQLWLESETDGPAPGNRPSKGVFKLLSSWREKTTIDGALSRMLQASMDWMASGSKSEQVAASWLEGVAHASIRSRQLNSVDFEASSTQQTGETLIRLAQMTGNTNETMGWLRQAGELDKRPDEWRTAFHEGIWKAIRESPDAGEKFLRALGISLGRHCQAGLVEDIALAAFRADQSPQRNVYLDNMLYGIAERERVPVLHSLVVRSSMGEAHKREVADYLANSRHLPKASGDGQLGVLVLASLLLSDGKDAVVDQASIGLADALESPDGVGSQLEELLWELRERNEAWRKTIKQETQAPMQELEAQLAIHRHEEDRLRQQVRTFRAHMASDREESRLEVRQGMLLAIGEVFDRAFRPGKGDAERLQAVIDGLFIALREGDAEPLGIAGELAPYDPRIHHSPDAMAKGSMVRLWSPGVIVRGGRFGDKIVLKANVTALEGAVEKSEVRA